MEHLVKTRPPGFEEWDKHNISNNEWDDFLKTLLNFNFTKKVTNDTSSTTTSRPEDTSDAYCNAYYCNNQLHNVLMDYKLEYHGYVTLVVRTFECFLYSTTHPQMTTLLVGRKVGLETNWGVMVNVELTTQTSTRIRGRSNRFCRILGR